MSHEKEKGVSKDQLSQGTWEGSRLSINKWQKVWGKHVNRVKTIENEGKNGRGNGQ